MAVSEFSAARRAIRAAVRACRTAVAGGVLVAALGCASVPWFTGVDSRRLAPFSSDGCSLFPEGTPSDSALWEACCVEHDMAYWQGGTRQDRRAADLRFRACIESRTGNPAIAKVMYDAVRAWGSPRFPSWYRWGYGWPYGRDYRPLTDAERRQVSERLSEYRRAGRGQDLP